MAQAQRIKAFVPIRLDGAGIVCVNAGAASALLGSNRGRYLREVIFSDLAHQDHKFNGNRFNGNHSAINDANVLT